MRGGAALVVGDDRGRPVLRRVRAEPPVTVRRCDDTILLVASAAAPVGGDEIELAVDVEAGATARIGSAAASVVWPGATGGRSTTTTRCRVGVGGHLSWCPEPTVSVRGSDHVTSTTVELAGDASCLVVEEVALGRQGEPSGALELRLRVERDGHPLVHHAERFGPDVAGAGSVVGVASARHVWSSVLVGPPAGEPAVRVEPDRAVARLPVAADVVVVLAVGPDRPAVLDLVAAVGGAPDQADAPDRRWTSIMPRSPMSSLPGT